MIKYFLSYFFVRCCFCATTGGSTNPTPALMNTNSLIQCGSTAFYYNSFVNLTTLQVSFNTAFPSNNPSTALGVLGMELYNLTFPIIGFDISFTNQSTSGFTISCFLYNQSQFNSIIISYLSIDSTITYISIQYQSLNLANVAVANGLRTDMFIFLFPSTMANSADCYMNLPFLTGAVITKGLNSDFYVYMTSSTLNVSNYQLSVTTTGNTLVSLVHCFIVSFDKTNIQQNSLVVLDVPFVIGNSNTSNTVTFYYSVPNNFFAGINSFDFSNSAGLSFNLSSTNFLFTTNTTFNSYNFSTINFRTRSCPTSPNFYYIEINNTCVAQCPSAYVLISVSNYCAACFYTCLTCYNTSSWACKTCSNVSNRSFILNQTISSIPIGQCSCISNGTYDDGSSTNCQNCSYTCNSCSQANNCLTCLSSMNRFLNGSSCQCDNGFFDNGVAQCRNCSKAMTGCYNCTSATICLTCLDGYYLDAQNTCKSCINNCYTCSNTTTCLSCNNNFILNASNCVCNIGYYLSTNSCVLCSSSIFGCISCTSSSICLSCNTSNNLVLQNNICICSTTYFLSGITCTLCSTAIAFCQVCNNGSVCLTCYPPFQFINNACECSPQTYYNSSLNQCLTCLSRCLSCNDGISCTSCDPALNLILNISNLCACMQNYADVNNNCILTVTCATTQYYNNSLISCTPCINCYTCQNSTSCLSCTLPLVLSNGQCQCPSTFQYYNSTLNQCIDCNSTMIACIGCTNNSICTSCDTSLNFRLSLGSCICNSLAYFSNSSCILCNSQITGCSSCTNQSVCTVCNSASQFINYNQLCVCKTGYYLSASSCQSCPASITGCLACSSSSYCINCDSTNNFNSNGTLCSCTQGYFLNISTCLLCNLTLIGCISCNQSNVCQTCNSTNNFILINSLCSCQTGYFYDNVSLICLICGSAISGCHTCSNSSACQQCFNGFTLNSIGLCDCPLSQFFNFNTGLCSSCFINCVTCNTYNTCMSCNSTLNRILNVSLLCTCDTNYAQINGFCVLNITCTSTQYYDQLNNQCKDCDIPCLTCTSQFSCTSCIAGLTLNSTVCDCYYSHYYYDNSSIGCLPCSSNCLTCANFSFCLTCDNSANLYLSIGQCLCQQGFINSTLGCLPTPNNSSCTSGYFLNGTGFCNEVCGDGIKYILQCDDGNLINGDGCNSSCQIQNYFICQGNHPTRCSYNGTINMSINSITKVLDSNSLQISIKMQPNLVTYSQIDFTSLFTTNSTSITIQSTAYQNGQLILNLGYNSTVQNSYLNLVLSQSQNSSTSITSSTNLSFQLSPTNNQPANFYPASTYTLLKIFNVITLSLTIISSGLLLIGILFSKLICIQMMISNQISILLLSLITNIPIYLTAVNSNSKLVLNYSGFDGNILVSQTIWPVLTPQINGIQYTAIYLKDCSYVVMIQLSIIVLSFIFQFISNTTKASSKSCSTKFKRYSDVCGRQPLFSILIVNSVNVGYSAMLEFIYNESKLNNVLLFLTWNKICLFISFFIRIVACIGFLDKIQRYEKYKRDFKKHSKSLLHPFILLIKGLLMGIFIGVATKAYICIYFVLVIQILFIAYMALSGPYKKKILNVRGILNEGNIFVCIFLILLMHQYTSDVLTLFYISCFLFAPSLCSMILIILMKQQIGKFVSPLTSTHERINQSLPNQMPSIQPKLQQVKMDDLVSNISLDAGMAGPPAQLIFDIPSTKRKLRRRRASQNN